MKAFINIIIISLIGLCSSTYLFNLSPIDYRGTIKIETPTDKSSLDLEISDDKLLNPESITINHRATKEEIVKVVTDRLFNVTIYKDNKLLKDNVDNLEFLSPSINATISVNENNPIISTLNLNQKALNLEDGIYEFVFTSNLIADEDKSTVSVIVTYDTAGNYYPAVNEAPEGTKGLTLYFATENMENLIPLTRFVVEDKSITRMAIEQLQNGPVNKGLKSAIKDVTNTTYNKGNVVIDVPSSYEEYDSTTAGGQAAYNSFVKTIFAVNRYWPVYSITFTVDRTRPETYFHGIDMGPVQSIQSDYLLYLAHKAGDRYYLFDYQLDLEEIALAENDTIEAKARKIFDAYWDLDTPNAVSPVPKSVRLNKASLQGRTLILDFNEDILNAYKDKDDLRHMMVESFVYTFTTIPEVDSIMITANGKEITDFIDTLDTTKALYPPEFINPESINAQ